MGAWGVGNFDNDSALDWMHDFLESEDKMTTLRDTFEIAKDKSGVLSKLFKKSSELEEPEATAVLAAGEIISLLLGKPTAQLPQELKDGISENQLKLDKSLVKDALRAVHSVRTNSELKVLWEETDDYQSWLEEVKNLENRLGQ